MSREGEVEVLRLAILVKVHTCGEVWRGWTEAQDETDVQNSIEYEIWVNGILSPLPVSGGIDVDFV